MRILLIRHGDPDYEHDDLTEKGRREAALLGRMAPSMNIDDCYVSPLGRARATASYSLKAMGKEAAVLDWLMEFPAKADISLFPELARAYPDAAKEDIRCAASSVVWDMVPSYWTEHPEYMEPEGWRRSAAARSGDSAQVYDRVCLELDRLLEGYGYVREGRRYRVVRESTRTAATPRPPVEHLPLCPVALSRPGPHLRDGAGIRRAPAGHRLLPGPPRGGYLPPVRRTGAPLLCGKVLRGVQQ